MTDQLLLFIFFLLVILAAGDIMRRAFLTLRKERREKEVQKEMRRLRRPNQPQVTVLIYAKHRADAIEATLHSLQKNRYNGLDVVVVNDKTNKQQYKAPARLDVLFLQRRVAGSKIDAYRAAYRKSRRGSVIVCLDGGVSVDPQYIKRAVATAADNQRWRVELTKEHHSDGIRELVASLSELLWSHRSFAWVYTPSALRREKKDPVAREVAWVLWWEAAMVLGVLAGFVLGSSLLWYVWLAFSGYLLALVWLKGNLSVSQKLIHSFAVPPALFLLPVTSFIEASFQLGTRK
jgi:hypothetical protein